MTFGKAILTGYRECVVFSGRASRSEFWWFLLYVVIATAIVARIVGVAHLRGAPVAGTLGLRAAVIFGLFLPLFAAGARRLHDSALSAWWLLLWPAASITAHVLPGFVLVDGTLSPGALFALRIVPLAIVLPLVALLLRPGTTGHNRYGADPSRHVSAWEPGGAIAAPDTPGR